MEVFEVVSEILSSLEKDSQGKPSCDIKNVVSKFRVKLPFNGKKDVSVASIDKDGDYIVPRKEADKDEVICLEHSVSTELQLVGLQLWRGALLLSDLVIHLREELLGQTVVELGSGVGLTAIIAAMYADHVISTDLDAGGILKLIEGNVARNKKLLKGAISVMGLDWFNLEWSASLQRHMEKATIILAADVVYDNSVTAAFIKTITKILSTPPRKTLYIALEKRYVFTIADLDSVAPCYEHLLQSIREEQQRPPWSLWTMVPVTIDFPQRLSYERLPQMVVWKITSTS